MQIVDTNQYFRPSKYLAAESGQEKNRLAVSALGTNAPIVLSTILQIIFEFSSTTVSNVDLGLQNEQIEQVVNLS